jgi:hypothetical protein
MTSLPPAEPSLPPRQRPSTETLAKNSTEEDLWDLTDLPADGLPDVAAVPVLPRNSIPGTTAAPPTDESPPILRVPRAPRHYLSQNANVERLGRFRPAQASPTEDAAEVLLLSGSGDTPLEDAFDNLEDWDLSDDLSPEPTAVMLPHQDPPVPVASVAPAPAPPPVAAPAPVAAAATPAPDEFAPVIEPPAAPAVPLRSRLGLTKLEGISLIGLAVLLLVGGFWVYTNSLSRLLRQSGQTQKIQFPIQGSHVTLSAVATYWRAPLNKITQVEAVRRGVVLIPVTELTLHGGPGAIRALVYNDSGLAVGDPITRQVDGSATLILPATDGFEDISMHAAYRTGQTKPWSVRISEAPSVNSPGKDFKPLLEVAISTEKR